MNKHRPPAIKITKAGKKEIELKKLSNDRQNFTSGVKGRGGTMPVKCTHGNENKLVVFFLNLIPPFPCPFFFYPLLIQQKNKTTSINSLTKVHG